MPRPEDVGFDGVGTLLREAEGGLLYAENSFCVQFKSASIASVRYEGHEAIWLKNLKLPFFIGSVDSKETTISLYTTYRLSQILMEQEYRKLSLHMHEIIEGSDPPEERNFNIGPPLLKWGFADLQSGEYRAKAYSMLKTVIESEEKNIKHRNIKYMEGMSWTTNETVTPGWA